jgi:hypothetical protein
MSRRPSCAGCECGDHAWAAATRGTVVLVSPEDRPLLAESAWIAQGKNGYVYRWKNGLRRVKEFLHRAVLDAPRGSQVDHVDMHGWDNRRHKLRLCSNQQNHANRGKNRNNTSGFKGVSFDKRAGRFVAGIKVDGRRRFLGSFITPEEASVAYSRAAEAAFGDFART